jgi:protein-tyrosine kinase
MERIREAVKLAKQNRESAVQVGPAAGLGQRKSVDTAQRQTAPSPVVVLNTVPSILDSHRIIAGKSGGPQVTTFDMLRTKILQEMDRRNWQVIVVTSPTPGCGKTVTAINLALSMSRQSERYVFLLDLDLRKPRVLNYLGVTPENDLLNVIRGEVPLEEAVFQIDIASSQLAIIGNKLTSSSPVEVIASRQMSDIMKQLRSFTPKPIIIVDMPPVLGSDDVLAFLPQADCCILAVAEGSSTLREIANSEKLLATTNVLGCVLTKSTEKLLAYY